MTAQPQEPQVSNTEKPVEKKDPQTSFAEVRKMLESERAKNEQMQHRIAELEKKAVRQPEPIPDDDFDSEPYIDPKTFRRRMSKLEESLESKIEKKAEEKARALIEEERKSSYLSNNKDFEDIMKPEVVQMFADKFPGMASAILKMPDGFERQKLVYEAIKSTGSHKKEEVKTIQQKVDENKRSPYYQPSGSGSPPYAGVGDFSDVGQKNAYQKMQELKNRLRLG